MVKGSVIFLNGVASSGKAGIAKSLQEKLAEPYLYFSVDNLLHSIPEKLMSEEGEDLSQEAERIILTFFPQLMSAIHLCIYTLAARGINLIVDHVLLREEWLDECVHLLNDYRVLFVGVYCEIDELERRERSRHRVEGLAKSQAELVHLAKQYDVVVDTCRIDDENCCLQILQALETLTIEQSAFHQYQLRP